MSLLLLSTVFQTRRAELEGFLSVAMVYGVFCGLWCFTSRKKKTIRTT